MLTSFTEQSSPYVAVRLARALANTGARVALLDADTSADGVSSMLNLQSYPGVADWLRDRYPDPSGLPLWSELGVAVVPIGSVDGRTADILTSDRFAEILYSIGDGFDYIIVTAAPVLTDAAALLLATHCDASVAVVELGTTTAPRVQAAADSFAAAGAQLIGAVAVAPEHNGRFPRHRKRLQPAPVSDPNPEPDLAPSP